MSILTQLACRYIPSSPTHTRREVVFFSGAIPVRFSNSGGEGGGGRGRGGGPLFSQPAYRLTKPSILDPSSIHPRSNLDPTSIQPRSILDPSSIHPRSILNPSSIHPRLKPPAPFGCIARGVITRWVSNLFLRKHICFC